MNCGRCNSRNLSYRVKNLFRNYICPVQFVKQNNHSSPGRFVLKKSSQILLTSFSIWYLLEFRTFYLLFDSESHERKLGTAASPVITASKPRSKEEALLEEIASHLKINKTRAIISDKNHHFRLKRLENCIIFPSKPLLDFRLKNQLAN